MAQNISDDTKPAIDELISSGGMEIPSIEVLFKKEEADLTEVSVTDGFTVSDMMEMQLLEFESVKPNPAESSAHDVGGVQTAEPAVEANSPNEENLPHICGVCSFEAKNIQSVMNHMRVHRSKKRVCMFCSLVATSQDELRLHLATHKKEIPHTCNYCGHGFFREAAYLNHKCSKRPKLCQFCGEPFFSRNRLKVHIKEKHNEETPKKRHCPHCEFSCWSSDTLNTHLRSHKGNKMLLCPHCTFEFFRLDRLQRHMIIHKYETSFTCPYCGSVFAKYGIVKLHMEIHKNRDLFDCSKCEYQSPSKKNLRVHRWRMHSTQDFACRQCHYTTSNFHRYKRHLLTHKGDAAKLHACSSCSYKTKYKWDLNRHTNSCHRKDPLYPCPNCDFKAMNLASLKRHAPFHTQKLPVPDFYL